MRRAITVLAVLFAGSATVGEQPVSFRDSNLKAAIEAQLHVSNPQPADMLKLVYLVAPDKRISDLTGLEHALSPAMLNLSLNSISDLSA